MFVKTIRVGAIRLFNYLEISLSALINFQKSFVEVSIRSNVTVHRAVMGLELFIRKGSFMAYNPNAQHQSYY